MALIIFNRKNAMGDWQSGWIRDNVDTYTLLRNTWKGWSSEKKSGQFSKNEFSSACFYTVPIHDPRAFFPA